MLKVIKSTGKKEDFKPEKLRESIIKTLSEANVHWNLNIVNNIEQRLVNYVQEQAVNGEIESDAIRDNLLYIFNSHPNKLRKAANAYKKYEEQKHENRNMREILDILSNNETDEKNENANINGYTVAGKMLHVGEEMLKIHARNHILSKDVVQAIDDGKIYIHDLNWLGTGSTTCMQIDLTKLFKDGYSTGHGSIREPSNIISATTLAAIAIQSNQNEQHGGQSIPFFDRYMAPYVTKTFNKELKKYMRYKGIVNRNGVQFQSLKQAEQQLLKDIYDIVLAETEKQTHQAMEGIVHNLCHLNSRAGSQSPFSSINFGLDTTIEGRMVSKQLLTAQMEGLGRGETPIFPILIYTLKKGINFNPEDQNYDIFKLAMECSSKRLFPTYAFVDASFNLPFYERDPEFGTVAYMGCRTRVMSNCNGREGSVGRGNASFVTINLPMLALNANGNIDKFFGELDNALDLCAKGLLERFDFQKHMLKRNFPFLMGQGIALDSDTLNDNDSVENVIKHFTLSIGFIGLAETLKVLTGKHHGESKESQKLGLRIVKYMRSYCDRRVKTDKLNWSLLATPAETYCRKSVEQIQKKYGYIDGVSDREYLTNSNHVPVYYNISIADKAKIEGPYHTLCNAGHIFYVEVDGDISKNLSAFEYILHTMSDNDIGYGAINIPIIEDSVCGHSWQGESSVCPFCGRNESDEIGGI